MKIAILVSMFPPKWVGGVEIATQSIAEGLAEKGHDVHVITSFDKEILPKVPDDDFFVHRVHYPKVKIFGSMFFWINIFFALKKIKPDIVHCQTVQMGVCGFLFKKIYKIPYIVWCHGFDVYFPWPGKKMISRFVLNNANAIVALTGHMKQELQKLCKKNIIILPNGIDFGKFQGFSKQAIRDRLNISSQEKIIVFIGGLRPVKGVIYLIEAFKIISQKVSEAKLFLVGNGAERKNLEEAVAKNGLSGCVRFIGEIPHEKIPEYLAMADMFVLPSLSEGFPLVILEAMASGLPIVASNVRGLPEIVKEGESGFLAEPKNSHQIAEKILLLLENDALRQKISDANQEKSQAYDWEHVTSEIEKIYSNVLNTPA